MDIKGVGSNQARSVYEAHNKAKIERKKTYEAKSDKLELSSEAKKLQADIITEKELNIIRKKIDEGYYNSEEVINKVVESIYKELTGSN